MRKLDRDLDFNKILVKKLFRIIISEMHLSQISFMRHCPLRVTGTDLLAGHVLNGGTLAQVSPLGLAQVGPEVDRPGPVVNTNLTIRTLIQTPETLSSCSTCMSLFLAHSTISLSRW